MILTSQELYFNLDTLEGYLKVIEEDGNWYHYSFTLAPDRAFADIMTGVFEIGESGRCVRFIEERRRPDELHGDNTRSDVFDWFARGLMGTPTRFKGREQCHKEIISNTT